MSEPKTTLEQLFTEEEQNAVLRQSGTPAPAIAAGDLAAPTIGLSTESAAAKFIPSTSDERVVNNSLRQQYRVLNDREKKNVDAIKQKGQEFLDLLFAIGTSRELSLAKTEIEVAVFWAVKHITA